MYTEDDSKIGFCASAKAADKSLEEGGGCIDAILPRFLQAIFGLWRRKSRFLNHLQYWQSFFIGMMILTHSFSQEQTFIDGRIGVPTPTASSVAKGLHTIVTGDFLY